MYPAARPRAPQRAACPPAGHSIDAARSRCPWSPAAPSRVSTQFKIRDLLRACTAANEVQSHPPGTRGSWSAQLSATLPPPAVRWRHHDGTLALPAPLGKENEGLPGVPGPSSDVGRGYPDIPSSPHPSPSAGTAPLPAPALIQLPGGSPHGCHPWPVALLCSLIALLSFE